MRTRLLKRAVMVGALSLAALGACGDDDETPAATGSATSTTTAASGGGDNELKIEMVDYGYKVTGSLKAGLATVTSTNTGAEWHMAGMARLKDGATVEQLTEALKNASPDSEKDPTEPFIEEQVDSPGHILQPGRTQSLTVDTLKAGKYVLLCYIPTEGEGVLHFAKGMVNGFEVEEAASGAEAPAEEASIVLPDDAEPTGVPTELRAGTHTFKVTSEGSKGKDFIVAQTKQGEAIDAFDKYFEAFDAEGGPPKGFAKEAPGTIAGSTFEVQPGQTIWITVEVAKGEVAFVNTTNSDDEQGDENATDKFVTVNVT